MKSKTPKAAPKGSSFLAPTAPAGVFGSVSANTDGKKKK